ncbi:13982_t:CDS:2, partial [Funneliformis geosporum]
NMNKNTIEITNNSQIYSRDVNDIFLLENRWALRNNYKYSQRGSGKCITAIVKTYLEGFFLAGNVNNVDQMFAKDMVMQLNQLVEGGKILVDEMSKIKTVKSWITRHLAYLHKESAEQRVIGESQNKVASLKLIKDLEKILSSQILASFI